MSDPPSANASVVNAVGSRSQSVCGLGEVGSVKCNVWKRSAKLQREIQRVTVMVIKEKITQFQQQKHLAYTRVSVTFGRSCLSGYYP